MITSKYRKTGGHESVMNNLSVHLSQLGYKVSIGSYSFEAEPPLGISKVRLHRFANFFDSFAHMDNGIIHSHQTQMNYYSLIAKQPFLFHYHGISSRIQEWNLKICFAMLKRHITKSISVSNSAADQMLNMVGKIPSEVIYNGVDTKLFRPNKARPFKKGDPQLLFVGNLFEYKNIMRLVDLMPSLLRKYPNAYLAIIGHGKQYRNIKSRIEHMGLSQNVELLGQVRHEELPPHYASCDAYVSASSLESFDLPSLEAMASGRPVALSDISSHTEIVKTSNAGRLFSLSDDQSIINCIEEVYQKRQSLGDAALKFAVKHDWSSVAKKVSGIYDQITNTALGD
jgi:glycosyltransferase involved in cell wall biosynthesis